MYVQLFAPDGQGAWDLSAIISQSGPSISILCDRVPLILALVISSTSGVSSHVGYNTNTYYPPPKTIMGGSNIRHTLIPRFTPLKARNQGSIANRSPRKHLIFLIR